MGLPARVDDDAPMSVIQHACALLALALPQQSSDGTAQTEGPEPASAVPS